MKIYNLKTRIAGKIAACVFVGCGFLSSSFVYSYDEIVLGDAGFEEYSSLGVDNYAYASDYRPTSAWVDDLDSPGGYTQDDADSNWLYNTAYSNIGGASQRAAPRTGSQAMHGSGNYSAQVVSEVFEAGMTYEFSLWAQADADGGDDGGRIWMYIFDGSQSFSEANSLEFARYAPDTGDFSNRVDGSSQTESEANWTQITLSHTVLDGAAEIGSTIGVAFWAGSDGAVDDATLFSATAVPEPSSLVFLGLGGIAMFSRRRKRS